MRDSSGIRGSVESDQRDVLVPKGLPKRRKPGPQFGGLRDPVLNVAEYEYNKIGKNIKRSTNTIKKSSLK